MEWLDYHIWFHFSTWMSLFILAALEIVLGLDNLVFIAIVSRQLPAHKQKLARRLGLAMALLTRLILLAAMKWVIGLTEPLFDVFDQSFSGKDLLLLLGGAYLIFEGTREIHKKTVKNSDDDNMKKSKKGSYPSLSKVVIKIMFLDIVFSLDSVITAVGMAQHFIVMALAIVAAVFVMLCASETLNRFIQNNPTLEMLALSFLLLIGTVLVADGFHFHVERGYVYFAILFAVFVESINIVASRRRKRG